MTGSSFSMVAPQVMPRPAGEDALFGNVRRLVPASGVQFLDGSIPLRPLAAMRSWFTEDSIDLPGGPRHVLLPLNTEGGADGTIWHPVTFKPLGPGETYSFTGLEAIEPFLDSWTPLPVLRFLGRDEAGRPLFDSGPSNWARVFLATPEGGLRGADDLKLVYAFDTRLDDRSRADQTPYLAPSSEDALFASTFVLADDPAELGDFLGQAWIETWIRETCEAAGAAILANDAEEAGFAVSRAGDGRFQHTHVGRYLALLRVLARMSAPPQIRFVDTLTTTPSVGTRGVDLVIDFGVAETTALLIESGRPIGPDLTRPPAHATLLRLRDLERPVIVHQGAIPATVEFDHATFGQAALSRRSGRADAFQWTSLVRIGHEALRLALRANATEGITGADGIGTQLANTLASEGVWRSSTSDREGAAKPAPMVSGEVLRHLSETGSTLASSERQLNGSGAAAAAPAVRPRFSQSSLAGLFLVEVLLHALGEVNSADPGSVFAAEARERSEVRRIARVILMPPLAMPPHERQILMERAAGAIDLLWRTQGWDRPGASAKPAKPRLVLGIGPDIGEQVVYLMREVETKLGGSFGALVDCIRRRTGEPDARDTLRIASLDVSRRSVSLTVIDYGVGHDGRVQASLVQADRAAAGSEQVLEAIVEREILPAVERALSDAGIADAHAFLVGLITHNASEERGQAILGKRLFSKILTPAAAALFQLYLGPPPQGDEGVRRFRLEGLSVAGGGRLGPVADDIDAAARAAGGTGFKLSDVMIRLGRRHVRSLVEAELWPTIDGMAEAVEETASDILLMAGDLGHVPDIVDHILELSPVAPGRVVVLGTGDAAAANALAFKGRAVLGAYAADNDLIEANGFRLAIRGLSRPLTSLVRADQPGLAAPESGRPAQTGDAGRGMDAPPAVQGAR